MIETARLRLRPLEPADAAALAAVWGDPEVMRWCGGAAEAPRLALAVERCRECQERHGHSPLAVVEQAGGALVGICGFKTLDEPKGVELIYHFRREVWGRGYATESVEGLLRWARERLPGRFVEASADPRNLASIHVLQKCGFRSAGERWYEDVQQLEPVFRLELGGQP